MESNIPSSEDSGKDKGFSMFNISSIRDTILQKIGTSETTQSAVEGGDVIASTSSTNEQPNVVATGSTIDIERVSNAGDRDTRSAKNDNCDILSQATTDVSSASVEREVDGCQTKQNQEIILTDASLENDNRSGQISDAGLERVRPSDSIVEDNPDTNQACTPNGDRVVEEMETEGSVEEPSPVPHSNNEIVDPRAQEISSPLLQRESNTDADSESGIVVKTEKNDQGYDHLNSSTAPVSFAEINENIEGFGNVFIKREPAEESDNEDVAIVGVSYRNPYSDSDDDTSSMSSFGAADDEADNQKTERNKKPQPDDPDQEIDDPKNVRTVGEKFPDELPPIEDLLITICDATKLMQIGVVSGIVDILVIVKSTLSIDGQCMPVNEDTVFFFENRKPFGKVFEVFGATRSPFYSVRFNTNSDIASKGIEVGMNVFFAPSPAEAEEDITHYVFVDSLLRMKGSDASWADNNEPPPTMVEYSDDDQERVAKNKRKKKKKQTAPDGEGNRSYNGEGAPDDGSSVSSEHNDGFRQNNRGRGGWRGRGGGFGQGIQEARPSFSGPSNRSNDQQRGSFSKPRCTVLGPPSGTLYQPRGSFSGPRSGSFSGPSSGSFSGPNSGSFSGPNSGSFSGSNSGSFSGPSSRFSGPPDLTYSQHQQSFSGPRSRFSGPTNGAHQQRQPMFCGPNDGRPSQQPSQQQRPSFSGPNYRNQSQQQQQQPGTYSGSESRMPPPYRPMFSGQGQQRPPSFSGPGNGMQSFCPPLFSGAPDSQVPRFNQSVPPPPLPPYSGMQGGPGQGSWNGGSHSQGSNPNMWSS